MKGLSVKATTSYTAINCDSSVPVQNIKIEDYNVRVKDTYEVTGKKDDIEERGPNPRSHGQTTVTYHQLNTEEIARYLRNRGGEGACSFWNNGSFFKVKRRDEESRASESRSDSKPVRSVRVKSSDGSRCRKGACYDYVDLDVDVLTKGGKKEEDGNEERNKAVLGLSKIKSKVHERVDPFANVAYSSESLKNDLNGICVSTSAPVEHETISDTKKREDIQDIAKNKIVSGSPPKALCRTAYEELYKRGLLAAHERYEECILDRDKIFQDFLADKNKESSTAIVIEKLNGSNTSCHNSEHKPNSTQSNSKPQHNGNANKKDKLRIEQKINEPLHKQEYNTIDNEDPSRQSDGLLSNHEREDILREAMDAYKDQDEYLDNQFPKDEEVLDKTFMDSLELYNENGFKIKSTSEKNTISNTLPKSKCTFSDCRSIMMLNSDMSVTPKKKRAKAQEDVIEKVHQISKKETYALLLSLLQLGYQQMGLHENDSKRVEHTASQNKMQDLTNVISNRVSKKVVKCMAKTVTNLHFSKDKEQSEFHSIKDELNSAESCERQESFIQRTNDEIAEKVVRHDIREDKSDIHRKILKENIFEKGSNFEEARNLNSTKTSKNCKNFQINNNKNTLCRYCTTGENLDGSSVGCERKKSWHENQSNIAERNTSPDRIPNNNECLSLNGEASLGSKTSTSCINDGFLNLKRKGDKPDVSKYMSTFFQTDVDETFRSVIDNDTSQERNCSKNKGTLRIGCHPLSEFDVLLNSKLLLHKKGQIMNKHMLNQQDMGKSNSKRALLALLIDDLIRDDGILCQLMGDKTGNRKIKDSPIHTNSQTSENISPISNDDYFILLERYESNGKKQKEIQNKRYSTRSGLQKRKTTQLHAKVNKTQNSQKSSDDTLGFESDMSTENVEDEDVESKPHGRENYTKYKRHTLQYDIIPDTPDKESSSTTPSLQKQSQNTVNSTPFEHETNSSSDKRQPKDNIMDNDKMENQSVQEDRTTINDNGKDIKVTNEDKTNGEQKGAESKSSKKTPLKFNDDKNQNIDPSVHEGCRLEHSHLSVKARLAILRSMKTAEMTSSRDVLDLQLADFVQLMKSLPSETPQFDKVQVMTAWMEYNFMDRCKHVAVLLGMVIPEELTMTELVYMQQEYPHVFCTFEGSRFLIGAYRFHCLDTMGDREYGERGKPRGYHHASWTALQNKNQNLSPVPMVKASRGGMLQTCQFTNLPLPLGRDDHCLTHSRNSDECGSVSCTQNCGDVGRTRQRQQGSQDQPSHVQNHPYDGRDLQNYCEDEHSPQTWQCDYNSSKEDAGHEERWLKRGESVSPKRRRRTRASLDRHISSNFLGSNENHATKVKGGEVSINQNSGCIRQGCRPGRQNHYGSEQFVRHNSESWPCDFNSSKVVEAEPVEEWFGRGESISPQRRRHTRASLDRHIGSNCVVESDDNHVMKVKGSDVSINQNSGCIRQGHLHCGSGEDFDDGSFEMMRNGTRRNVTHRWNHRSYDGLGNSENKELRRGGRNKRKDGWTVELRSVDSRDSMQGKRVRQMEGCFSAGGRNEHYEEVKRRRQGISRGFSEERDERYGKADLNHHTEMSFNCRGESPGPGKRKRSRDKGNTSFILAKSVISANGKYFQQ